MTLFSILRNAQKDPDGLFTERIVRYLEEHGKLTEVITDGAAVSPRSDCLIVLGGDGTVLRAVGRITNTEIPLIGINLGSLGYLTEVPQDAIEPALDQLIREDYILEKRMMLEGSVLRNGTIIDSGTALNDIVISRRGPLQILRFVNYVNGIPLSSFSADGMIVATPTGSTGYSLSAGGPIVSPSASLMIMTPIASHTLNSRSIVFPDSDCIRIEIGEGRFESTEAAAVYFDGERDTILKTGDVVEIRKAHRTTSIVKLSNISFLEVLRNKMQTT